jgi:hypothetical protein
MDSLIESVVTRFRLASNPFKEGDSVAILALVNGRRVTKGKTVVTKVTRTIVTTEDGSKWSSKDGSKVGDFGPIGSKIGVPWIELTK